jgi:hypothetical protein
MKPRSPKQLVPVGDPARLFKLNWELIYSECDLGPKHLECKPVLSLYLGSQFVREPESGGVVHIPLDEDRVGLDKRYTGSLVGTLRRDLGSVLPMGAPIGIASHAVHRNDLGTPCYVDVGSSMALVGDVVAEIQQRGRYDHEHELLIRTAMLQGEDHIRKGVIRLRVTGYQLGPNVKLPSQLPAVGTQALVLERIAATQTRDQTVMGYIQATMQHEQRFPDALPNIQRVRVPMDISETGASITGGTYLPIAAYAMTEAPRSNNEYWFNAFERVMARMNLAGPRTPAEVRAQEAAKINSEAARAALRTQAIAAYNQMDTRAKANVMAMMIGYGVQTMDYIGDAYTTANRNRMDLVRGATPALIAGESMTNGWFSGALDCEDGAKAILTSWYGLLGANIVGDAPIHKTMREVQAIAREYIPAPALSIVHGAKIGDEEGFGAHMYLPMFPKAKFMEALARTSDGRALLERMEPIPAPRSTLMGEAVSVDEVAWKREELVGLTLEGTGMLPPQPAVDPILPQRRAFAQNMPSTHGYKQIIPHSVPNPFYMAITNIIPDFFMKMGLPVGGFVVGQADKEHEMRRGILYEDFLNNSPKLAIAPQPFIPQPVMSVINEANASRPPPRAHILDWSKPLAGPDRDPLLDRLVGQVRSMGREAPRTHPANSVDMFIKPHQYGLEKVQAWIADASRFGDLYDASYQVEHITNDMFTYQVRFWVK